MMATNEEFFEKSKEQVAEQDLMYATPSRPEESMLAPSIAINQ